MTIEQQFRFAVTSVETCTANTVLNVEGQDVGMDNSIWNNNIDIPARSRTTASMSRDIRSLCLFYINTGHVHEHDPWLPLEIVYTDL